MSYNCYYITRLQMIGNVWMKAQRQQYKAVDCARFRQPCEAQTQKDSDFGQGIWTGKLIVGVKGHVLYSPLTFITRHYRTHFAHQAQTYFSSFF